ncbi:hypothetical protein A9Q84_16505 [Halobacteriovorax marinus]|uniref:Uncharacterized protein n=1 Tax=Halobacteriovorax marinus TaxID=97084 RepID=A0A1Y5F4P4_9BACT|nr:hypothetical protein A9Q84_16505 [Halobacteriovorax marinus]
MLEKWNDSYWLGQNSLNEGNFKSAYLYAVECNSILRTRFRSVNVVEQVDVLDKYYQTVLLLKSCSEAKGCRDCVVKQISAGMESLKSLYDSNDENTYVRVKAGELLISLNRDLAAYYKSQEMLYELSVLKSTVNENKYKFLLIK